MTNIERIIQQAKDAKKIRTQKINEAVDISKIYDNIQKICFCEWHFATKVVKSGHCTARDIFEMEYLSYNFTILSIN
jgi:hypothetical protein